MNLEPLDIQADLTLTVDGEPVAIKGEGGHVVVALPSVQAGRALFRWPGARDSVPRLSEMLRDADVTMDVRMRGESVATLGAGAKPRTWNRLLHIGPVNVRPTAAVRAARKQYPLLGAVAIGAATGLTLWGLARLWRR